MGAAGGRRRVREKRPEANVSPAGFPGGVAPFSLAREEGKQVLVERPGGGGAETRRVGNKLEGID